jgi:DNA-binding NarL/FixJ family response regulator
MEAPAAVGDFGDNPERAEGSGFSPRAVRWTVCDDSGVAGRVLIVDDHEEFRTIARTVLEAEGFEVVGEAVDGAATLAAVEGMRPDIVLLDVQLPDVNGFDVARTLCDRENCPAVVMISSRDASDFGARIALSGARGFIPKSQLSGAALAALVRR